MARITLVAAICMAICSQATAQTRPRMRCDFYKTVDCTAAQCFDATAKSWSIIDWEGKDYSLCDNTSCQHVAFEPFPDGIYVSLTFPKRDLMFKLNTTDNSAVETSTFMNAAVISFGNCAKDATP